MKVVRYTCENIDSCTPGTTHLYPARGETVTVLFDSTAHVRGEEDDIEMPAGSGVTVAYSEPEMHCVGSFLWDGREILLPIDDLDWPEGLTEVDESGAIV